MSGHSTGVKHSEPDCDCDIIPGRHSTAMCYSMQPSVMAIGYNNEAEEVWPEGTNRR